MTEDDIIRKFVEDIDVALSTALANALSLQQTVHNAEGDSDLYRKLSFYLIPSLTHWITGAQAGNVKDLHELLAKRVVTTGEVMEQLQGSKRPT